MPASRPKRADERPQSKSLRGRKERYIMIRVSDAQKAQIEHAVDPDEKVATWAREALVKLAKGWRLVPPGAKITPADDGA